MTLGQNVCVIGAGVIGLGATKNLIEEGFQVTTFERHTWVGGNWHATDDEEQTSVLPWTTSQVSKQAGCYTDFPFPDDTPLHPTAKQSEEYLDAYAEHFKLLPHIRFATVVTKIERDEKQQQWIVYTKARGSVDSDAQAQTFDKLVYCTGCLNKPNIPQIQAMEKFEADVLHSRQFKKPQKYEGKNVLIVGLSATAVDVASILKAHGVGKIYISHRQGARMFPRKFEGRAFDQQMSRRMLDIGAMIRTVSPALTEKLQDSMMAKMQAKAFPQLLDHKSFNGSRPRPPAGTVLPFFSEDLVDMLCDGTVETVVGLDGISGPRSVTLADSTTLSDLDAIIFCTGYTYDFSLLPSNVDPTNPSLAPDSYQAARAAPHFRETHPGAQLYRGFLSTAHPESLAILGYLIILGGIFSLYDRIPLALAHMWKGSYPYPTEAEIRRDLDESNACLASQLHRTQVAHPGLRFSGSHEYERWLNKVAGTGVNEKFGWGLEGWKFWWQERELYDMLMTGPMSPHIYRLFETGRRKAWPGAREAIEKANRAMKESVNVWKEKQEKYGAQASHLSRVSPLGAVAAPVSNGLPTQAAL